MASTAVIYELIARDNASRVFARVGTSAGSLEKSLSSLARAAKVVGEALVIGGAAVAGASVKMAADFQSAMIKIQTQAGGSAQDVRDLSDQVLKLGEYAEQSPKELADALFHLKSVGLDNVDAMKALRSAADLAAVGGANLEETTNALAGAWRTGIKGAQDFGETAATLNAIIGAGNMKMQDLVDAMGTGFLASAKTFGLSLRSVGSALAVMTDEGVPANEAATRLRMTFSLLGAPSHVAQKALSQIGVTGLQLANAMRGPEGLIGAVGLLKDHLDKSGMSASEAAQLLSEAFGGGRSSSAIMTLVNNFDVLQQKQDQINQGMGRFGDAVQEQRKTFDAQIALMKSSVEVLAVRIGTRLIPPLTGFVQWLSGTAFPAVLSFGDTVRTKLGFDKIPGIVANAKKAVTDFFAKGGFENINWREIGGKLGHALVEGVLNGLSSFGQLADKLLKLADQIDWVNVGKTIGGHAVGFSIGFVSNLFADLFTADFWKKHWLDVILALLAAFPVGKLLGALGKILEHIPILRVFSSLFTKIGGALEKIGKPIWDALGKVVKAIGHGFVQGFGKVFPEAMGTIGKFFDELPTRLGVYGLQLLELGKKLAGKIGDGIKAALGKVGEAIGWLVGQILRPFASAGSWLLEHGKKLVGGLLRGIGDGASAIWGWLTDHVFSPIGTFFANAFDWLVGNGIALVNGFLDGAGRVLRTIWDWLTGHVLQPIGGFFANSFQWLIEHGAALINGFLDGARRILSTIGGWLSDNVFRPIGGFFVNTGTWLVDHGRDMISGLLGGIWDAMKGIGGWLKDHIWRPIVDGVKSLFGIHSPSTVFAEFGHNMILGLIEGLVKGNAGAFVSKIFGGVSNTAGQALSWLVSHGEVALQALGGVASSIWGKITGFFGGGGGASGPVAGIVRSVASGFGWGAGAEWDALSWIISHESGWNPRAQNPSSTAFGLFQFLDSTWGSVGAAKTADPALQAIAGMRYIAGRYGDPLGAKAFWQAHNWYGDGLVGGIFTRPTLIGVGERGPERVDVTPLGGRPGSRQQALVGGDLNVYVTEPNATSGQILRDTLFELRRIRHGGVYA